MPQFVEIPAPVTTMVFLERAIESAIVCNCREQSDVTVSIGIFEEVVFVFVGRLYVRIRVLTPNLGGWLGCPGEDR
jgi:hypothetical protein